MSVYYLYTVKLGGGNMNSAKFCLPDGFYLKTYSPTLLRFIKGKNTFKDVIWKCISFGRCRVFAVTDRDGRLAHKSLVIGRNFKFPFLAKEELEIGPCFTACAYRGQGIYPCVLRHIVEGNPNKRFLMLVREDNVSSICGIEKAGFERIGLIGRKRFGRWARI